MNNWKIFKEKLPPQWNPMWVVWDEYGEYLFRTGAEALEFVNCQINQRMRWHKLQERMRKIL